MATDSRNERQLMRQRGAGSRNINSVDFGFAIGAQGSRDERQLMRQRGAGNRKVDNIDFGFSFPTLSASRRSASRTPQVGRRTSSRLSRTPQGQSQELSITRSTRQNSAQKKPLRSERRRLSQTPGPIQSSDPPSSKRRTPNPQPVELQDAPPTSVRRSVSTVFAIAEEDEAVPDADPNKESDAREESGVSAPIISKGAPETEDKENDQANSEGQKTKPKRKKRKSVIQHIGRKKKRKSNESGRESIMASVEVDDAQAVDLGDAESEPEHDMTIEHIVDASPVRDVTLRSLEHSITDETRPEEVDVRSTKRARKRKSVVLGPKKRRSSGRSQAANETALPTPEPTQEMQSAEVSDNDTEANDSQDEQDEQDVEETGIRPTLMPWKPGHIMERSRLAARRRRARMSVSTSPSRQVGAEQEGDETYVEEDHTPEPPTPAPKRKQKRKRNSTSTNADNTRRTHRSQGSTFPILTHRMTNLEALPTIPEHDETNHPPSDEEDPLSRTFIDRPAPNAIDVLAQICRETIETAMSKLPSQPSHTSTGTSRAALKHKRQALTDFSHALDQRLFDMSEAVEHRLTIESRLRRSKREKSDLQARWMELRRQRDELALKTDEIRRQNWDAERETKTKVEISELAFGVELDLHREGVEEEEGLEFLLKRVAGLVSCKGRSGGLLERVRGFNERLERLVSGLEGREI